MVVGNLGESCKFPHSSWMGRRHLLGAMQVNSFLLCHKLQPLFLVLMLSGGALGTHLLISLSLSPLPQATSYRHLSSASPPCQTRKWHPCNYDILGVILTISHYSKKTSAIPIFRHKEMILTSLNSLSNMPGEIKRC